MMSVRCDSRTVEMNIFKKHNICVAVADGTTQAVGATVFNHANIHTICTLCDLNNFHIKNDFLITFKSE